MPQTPNKWINVPLLFLAMIFWYALILCFFYIEFHLKILLTINTVVYLFLLILHVNEISALIRHTISIYMKPIITINEAFNIQHAMMISSWFNHIQMSNIVLIYGSWTWCQTKCPFIATRASFKTVQIIWVGKKGLEKPWIISLPCRNSRLHQPDL